MKLRACVVVAGVVTAGAAAADTDPYPFEGYFALRTPGAAHAGCGFDVLHQTHGGAFSGYILDRAHWEAQGQARFIRYKHGTCTFDAATGIDNCVANINHISAISEKPDRAKVTVLDRDTVAMLTLGEETAEALKGVPPFVFERCPFAAAQIEPLLSDTANSYAKAALQEMARSRDASISATVVEKIKSRQVEEAR